MATGSPPAKRETATGYAFDEHSKAAEREFDKLPRDVQAALRDVFIKFEDELSLATYQGRLVLHLEHTPIAVGTAPLMELRTTSISGQGRAYFVLLPSGQAWVLGYLFKTTERIPTNVLATVRRRAKEVQ